MSGGDKRSDGEGGLVGWVGWKGWLGWSASPLVVMCIGIIRGILLLLLAPQKWQLGFGLLYLIADNLSQLPVHAVILSLLQFLYILLLKEMFFHL